MSMKREIKCFKCGVYLEPRNVPLEYVCNSLHLELPVCPICGQVYMPMEMAQTKVQEYEKELEEK